MPATNGNSESVKKEEPTVEKKVDVFTTGQSDDEASRQSHRDENDSISSEDEMPLKAKVMNGNKNKGPFKSNNATPSSSSDEDDVPLAKKVKTKAKPKRKAKKDASSDDYSSSEDEKPLAKRKKVAAPKKKADKKPAAPKKPKKEASASVSPVKKGKAKSEEGSQAPGSGDEDDGVYAWWEEEQNGEQKVSSPPFVLLHANE